MPSPGLIRVSESYINVALKSCMMATGDRPRTFQPWSSDEDMVIPSPNFHTPPKRKRFSFDRYNAPQHCGSSAALRSNS
ncbi:hypothetical protein TNCV_2973761 [Trichonephila clavipes]|nr:hypothetical protein TNCV_2973761 [Trichonephila clavipes]